jgi:hypothetical protein
VIDRDLITEGAGSPGPADYNYEAHAASTRPLSPRQPMGSAARFREGGEDGGVGPADYNADAGFTRAASPRPSPAHSGK